MLNATHRPPRSLRMAPRLLVLAGAAALVLSACADGADGTVDPAAEETAGSDEAPADGETIGISLIVKTSTNPFFLAMQAGAEAAAEAEGVELTFAAGKEDGDEDTQIQAIENAISQGQAGILITPNGPGVLDAIAKAREAGLYVIALDTPPDPIDAVDITYATDNFDAGLRIGEWTAGQMDGEDLTIALLDLFDDKIVSVDYNRDQGFLTGLGIDTKDIAVNGDEDATGSWSGGSYTIVCNEATNGAEDGGTTAMETCLSKNPDINVVYTINEPAAYGAYQALQNAGKGDEVTIVSIDGGCAGVGYVEEGIIDATSQQYPVRMAEEGIASIAALVRTGEQPSTTEGLDFYDTGVALVTDTPADGVESIDAAAAKEICWG